MIYWCEERSRVNKTIHQREASLHSQTLMTVYKMSMWWNANCDLVCGRLQLLNNERERVRVGVFYEAGPDARWTLSCPKGWFQKQAEEDEIREEKESDVRRRRAQDKDAEEASLADAPSSQLTESVINSLVLLGNMANHQAWLPNTLTWNISKAYRCTHAIQGGLFHSGLQCLELGLNSLDKSHCDYLRRQSYNISLGILFFKSNKLFKGFYQQHILLVNKYSLTGLKYFEWHLLLLWLLLCSVSQNLCP